MAIQCWCGAGRINSVLWSLSLVSIIFMYVYMPLVQAIADLVQASADDDTELEFYWDPPPTGDVNVSYYNVYLFVYDNSPDVPEPGEDDYILVDDTSRTHRLPEPTPTMGRLYKLCDTLAAEPIEIKYGKGYRIQVAAVDASNDTNIVVGPRSEPSEIVWHIKYGDTNVDGLIVYGDTDSDAYLVLEYSAGLIPFTLPQLTAGDVSDNGEVTPHDASLIMQYVEGIIDAFPVEQSQTATVSSETASLAAEAGAGVEITAPDLTGRAGDHITALIDISDVTGLGIISVYFILRYDAGILTATGATALGTVAESWGLPYSNVTPGQIIIPMASISPLTGSGHLVSISFHVNADAGAGNVSELSIVRADLNEGGIPATIANGSFEVITSSNQPPVAHDQSVVTAEDTAVSITLTGDDPDGDPLIYTIVDKPSNGALSGTTPNVVYIPKSGFVGNDSFTFRVNDGTIDSNTATVTISVNSPENVTAMVLVDEFDHSYNQSTNETSVMVTWTNTGTSRLSLPLLMVIENTLPSSIYVTNADDKTPDGKPYYDYSDRVGGGKLDPGKTSGARQLTFSGPKNILGRMKFTFDVSCWAVIESSAAVESVASLSIIVEPVVDSDSRSFLPPTQVPPGWQLISIPVKPIDMHPSAVLSSIEGKYSSVCAYDPDTGWSVYAPGLPGGLQSMEPGRGYWIKMEEEGTLDVKGDDPEQTAVTLIGGKWNLVGYNSQDPGYAEECMEHVAYAINSVWGYDPDTGWSVYEPGSPSDLTTMKPWYGYWIKADQTCKWDVNRTNGLATPSAAVK